MSEKTCTTVLTSASTNIHCILQKFVDSCSLKDNYYFRKVTFTKHFEVILLSCINKFKF